MTLIYQDCSEATIFENMFFYLCIRLRKISGVLPPSPERLTALTFWDAAWGGWASRWTSSRRSPRPPTPASTPCCTAGTQWPPSAEGDRRHGSDSPRCPSRGIRRRRRRKPRHFCGERRQRRRLKRRAVGGRAVLRRRSAAGRCRASGRGLQPLGIGEGSRGQSQKSRRNLGIIN